MPENEPPLVSIIMPAFNVEPFIAEAIDSVMKQNLPRMELLIVDDESVDDTVKIIETNIQLYGSRIRLIRQKHQGVSAARNAAILAAQGTLIAFLDSDDVWPDGIISDHVDLLCTNNHLYGVRGMISSFKQSDDLTQVGLTRSSELFSNTQLGALVVRKDVFALVGMFDTTLSHGEDTDWSIRATEKGITFVQSERLSLHYRRRAGSLTDRKDSSVSSLLSVLKRKIGRQREGQAVPGASP